MCVCWSVDHSEGKQLLLLLLHWPDIRPTNGSRHPTRKWRNTTAAAAAAVVVVVAILKSKNGIAFLYRQAGACPATKPGDYVTQGKCAATAAAAAAAAAAT